MHFKIFFFVGLEYRFLFTKYSDVVLFRILEILDSHICLKTDSCAYGFYGFPHPPGKFRNSTVVLNIFYYVTSWDSNADLFTILRMLTIFYFHHTKGSK